MAKLEAKGAQVTPVTIGEGDFGYLQSTKQGALYSADWVEQAIRAGYGWSITVGSITAGTDISRITGGGNGTCVDQDQPEIAIGLGSGWLVPIRIMVSAYTDIDADAEYANIIATVDTAANGMSSAPTGTLETPANLLDGAGGSCGATIYSAITADITDPTVSEILDEANTQSQLTTSGVYTQSLKMDYQPKRPPRYAGPCTIYTYWGGTAATTAVARAEFLVLPVSWFPTS